MQYTHRSLQRSVIDTRRYEIRWPKASSIMIQVAAQTQLFWVQWQRSEVNRFVLTSKAEWNRFNDVVARTQSGEGCFEAVFGVG